MTYRLPTTIENELRGLAEQRHRGVEDLVQEAIRQYLDAAAITDLEPADIAATQMSLTAELSDTSAWSDPQEPAPK